MKCWLDSAKVLRRKCVTSDLQIWKDIASGRLGDFYIIALRLIRLCKEMLPDTLGAVSCLDFDATGLRGCLGRVTRVANITFADSSIDNQYVVKFGHSDIRLGDPF